jgi:hypothetical protein
VDEAADASGALGADADMVTRLGPIGLDGEALVAGRDELHGPVQLSCR